MNVADVVTEWGRVYRAGSASVADLMTMIRKPSETEAVFNIVPTDSTIIERVSVKQSRVLQAFQKAFTPTGSTTWKPNKIELDRMKIDVSEYPDDLEDTWLAFLAGQGQNDRKLWPFVKWWLETQVIPQSKEDLEVNEIFTGVTGVITPGTATAAGASMNGARKKLRAGVSGGTMNSIATGAPETDPALFVKQIDDFFYQIPREVRRVLDAIYMDHDLVRRYKDGMDQLYNTNYRQVDDIATIRREKTAIMGLESMSGSDMWWCTPSFNRGGGRKWGNKANGLAVESVVREVRAFTDYRLGVGYFIDEYVYLNDQDLS